MPMELSIVMVAEKIAPLARMKLSMSTSLMSTSRTRAGFLAKGDHIASHAVFIVADAAAFPGELALAVDDARAEQLGDDVDDAGAADAERDLAADDGEGSAPWSPVNRAGINRAVGGTHTAGDVAALKGGPAEQAQDIRNSLLPNTSSPLVPRSMNSASSSRFQIIEASAPAVMSPPT